MSHTVVDHGNENTRVFDSRSEAEDKAAGVKQMVSKPGEIEVVSGALEDYSEYQRAGDPGTPAAKKADPRSTTAADKLPETDDTEDALDELGDSLGTDPLSILPGHMIDKIQGQPAINKRGYAMIAERYGVAVQAHIEQYPWDNDGGRCVARAVATTENGATYQDYATACAEDGDMPEQLVELASTRALKRCVSWATGMGIVSYQELASELE